MLFEKTIEKKYRAQFHTRYDDVGLAYYFSTEDFPDLTAEPYAFLSRDGNRLQGYFYHYDNPIPGRVVVFDHGMGGGHHSYFREIEKLARHGYLVFAYDHTGCMESEGDSTNGLAQSLSDMDACLDAIKADFGDLKISVMGHSWGGYAAMNIPAYHPDVAHVIVLSGFVSVSRMLRQVFGGVLRAYYRPMMELECSANPDYVCACGIAALKNTSAEVLIIHDAEDQIIRAEQHFNVLWNKLIGRKNIHFLKTHGKGHNPNYTEDAVRYLGRYFAELKKKLKEKSFDSPVSRRAFVIKHSWRRMTEQDDSVWEAIFTVLNA